MQIETTMRYPLTPVRTTIIKTSINNKGWRGCGEKGSLLPCGWEYKLVQLLWRTTRRVPKKLKIELPHDPAIPRLGMYPEKSLFRKDTCTPMFIYLEKIHARQCSHYLQQPRREASISIGRGKDKEDVDIVIVMEYYSAIKRTKQCHLQQHG